MADLDRQNVVREARSALRANAHGSFEEQAPHLCSLLESLPVLGPNTAVLQAALCGGAEEMGADEVLKRLKESWVCHRSSQEGAIQVEVGREMEQLTLTFHYMLESKD